LKNIYANMGTHSAPRFKKMLVIYIFTVGNCFVGMSEAILLIKPYLKEITTSELFAVMTAGFGSVSVNVLDSFIAFGVSWCCKHV